MSPAPLPSFLAGAPAPVMPAAARPRLFDAPVAQAGYARDAYVPAPAPPLRPVLDPNGQIVAYVQVPVGPPPQPLSKNQQAGRVALSTVNSGLGVAGVFAPPLLPFAAAGTAIQAVDQQLGGHLTDGVGAVTRLVGQAGEVAVDGVVGAAKGVGRFFGKLF